MSDFTAAQLCFAMAETVRVLGMKAENKKRELNGQALAYDEAAFVDEAIQIEAHATHIQQQSW